MYVVSCVCFLTVTICNVTCTEWARLMPTLMNFCQFKRYVVRFCILVIMFISFMVITEGPFLVHS